MLSKQSIADYRAMSLSERIGVTLNACRRHDPCLLVGIDEDHIDRKFELIRRENEARNKNLIAAFKRCGE